MARKRKPLTPEQRERHRERQRRRRENMTPEQRERERERKRRRRENMTPEQLEAERASKRIENMTPEQLERHREAVHRREENMAPEQRYRRLLGADARLREKYPNTCFAPPLSEEQYVVKIAPPLVCHYCGAGGLLFAASGYWIDRRRNDRGYELGNCVVCCTPCNYEKGDKTWGVEYEWKWAGRKAHGLDWLHDGMWDRWDRAAVRSSARNAAAKERELRRRQEQAKAQGSMSSLLGLIDWGEDEEERR